VIETNQKVAGLKYMLLVLASFVGLLLDAVVAYGIMPIVYGKQLSEWTDIHYIIYWMIICAIWGSVSFAIFKIAKRKFDLDIMMKGEKLKLWQWIVIVVIALGSLLIKYFDWDGIKILIEFQTKGCLKFVFQYIYYCFEILLVVLILIFGQKAFEKWFKKVNIPYGGIVIACTWGIAHFFTKDILTGVLSILVGLAYGSVYLLVNRDIRKTYIILLLMFVL
jgi:drug/metabolite transporter (DMT)-like permease